MNVLIVGTGKLARELLDELQPGPGLAVRAWAGAAMGDARAIVVHAGSGRELGEALAFCARTGSTLIELATGSAVETAPPPCPVVLCPNTNLLMLKFMRMLARSGALFSGYDVRIVESHQAGKTSTPGTALALAASLGRQAGEIESVRDPAEQQAALGIPPEHLARHAFHRLTIEDPVCRVVMETRVLGAAPYAAGLAQIIQAVQGRELAPRVHPIDEFIENGWV